MLLQYLSDLHLETLTSSEARKLIESILPVAPVLVLAGDLGNPFSSFYKDLFEHVSSRFKVVFVVAGNHEFYGKELEETLEQIEKVTSQFENVIFLNESSYSYGGYTFVGTTLWSKVTDISLPKTRDTEQIKGLSVSLYTELFEVCSDFLSEVISESKEPLVVVTHHLPSHELVDKKYDQRLSQWFASDLDHLLKEPVKLWICGHTHTPFEKEINGVKVVCNPVGYIGENKPDFTKTFLL